MAQNKLHKKYQRQFTKILRKTNKILCDDNLWLGRFYVGQIGSRWQEFSDLSGGVLHVQVRLYDKESGYSHDYIIEYWEGRGSFYYYWDFDVLNKFVVEDSAAWEVYNPYKNGIKDYRGVKVPHSFWTTGNNWWEAYHV